MAKIKSTQTVQLEKAERKGLSAVHSVRKGKEEISKSVRTNPALAEEMRKRIFGISCN